MKKIILLTVSLFIISCQNKPSTALMQGRSPSSESASSHGSLSKEALAEKVQLGENTLMTKSRQLSFVGSRSGEGYYSQDGSKMIYQSEREPGNPFYQMYVLDLKSGHQERLSPGQGKTTCGWIHPNLKTALWSSTHHDKNIPSKVKEEYETRKKPVKGRYSWSFDDEFDIYTSDLHGKNIKRLTKEKGYDAEASYSPDGQWIAFASNRSAYTDKLSEEDQKMFEKDASYLMDIYIMKSDGTQVKRLTDTKGYDGGPFFSADGKKITWRRFAPNGATAEIYTMNVDGSQQKQVTRLGSMSWAPYFHPSGDYIIFTSSVLGYANFELFIVDAEGTKKPVRVTNIEGFDGLPTFSPDGNQISWTHKNEKGDSQIFLADWDDAQARKLLGLPAKDLAKIKFSSEIKKEDIKDIIYYLASDEMGGRKTGGMEEKIYTQKIADLFKSWGMVGAGPQGSFFHTFEYTSGVELGAKNSFKLVGSVAKEFKVSENFQPFSMSKVGEYHEAPMAFVGYGIKAPASDKLQAYDSYAGLDVKGKWVVAFMDLPDQVSQELRQHLLLFSRVHHKITVAKNEGALGLILLPHPESLDKFDKVKFEGALSESTIPVLKVSFKEFESVFKALNHNLKEEFSKLDQGQKVESYILPSLYAKAQVDLEFKKSTGTNVVGKLDVKSNQALIIGAHGDHLGHGELGNSLARQSEKGLVHYGADDNASGVSGVLELAHYFSDLKKKNPKALKKDIHFAVWSGEEIGVLGSHHFIKDFSKMNVNAKKNSKISDYYVANINMDMIGRLRDTLQIQGVGSATYWPQIAEEVSLKQALPLSLQDDPYVPTDSMSFYLAEIPAITFFTGAHGEYHSPRDRAELINYTGIEKIVEAVKYFSELLTDSSVNMLKYVKVGGDSQKKLEGRTFRVYLGSIPDYSQEGVKGVRISGTSKGSPAEKAGLMEKDIIVEFAGQKIENLYDYVYALQSAKPNIEVSIKVKRGEDVKELKITPMLKE